MARSRKKSWMPGKKTVGMLIGILVLVAVLSYMYTRKPTTKVGPHALPKIGRGFGSTPYGQPAGNPGALRSLGGSGQQGGGCGCHPPGDIHV